MFGGGIRLEVSRFTKRVQLMLTVAIEQWPNLRLLFAFDIKLRVSFHFVPVSFCLRLLNRRLSPHGLLSLIDHVLWVDVVLLERDHRIVESAIRKLQVGHNCWFLV